MLFDVLFCLIAARAQFLKTVSDKRAAVARRRGHPLPRLADPDGLAAALQVEPALQVPFCGIQGN